MEGRNVHRVTFTKPRGTTSSEGHQSRQAEHNMVYSHDSRSRKTRSSTDNTSSRPRISTRQARRRLTEMGLSRVSMAILAGCIVLAGGFVQTAEAQGPRQNLCRRWDAQTAVVDNTLYLMGGYVLLKDHVDQDSPMYNEGRGQATNEFISLDLSKEFEIPRAVTTGNVKTPPPWQPINGLDFIGQGESMAAISGGGFFTASPAKKVNGRAEGATPARKIYLYEGKFANTTGLSPLLAGKGAESQILSFNIDEKKWEVEDHWNNAREDGEAKAASEISRYSRGTAVDIPGQSGGFYIGGARIWEKEDKYEWYYPEDVQLADMDFGGDKVAKKLEPLPADKPEEPSLKTLGPAAAWIPIGDKGSLIVVGGTNESGPQRRFGSGSGKRPPPESLRSIGETRIYDIAKKKWYTQASVGDVVPSGRTGACMVAATDINKNGNITHQLFLYGGSDGSSFSPQDPLDDTVFFGDLYVLDIPSFQWIAFRDLENPPAPRTRHTCHVVNERQMLIIGGGDGRKKDECILDDIEVLDMVDMRWERKFKPIKDGKYKANEAVVVNTEFQGNRFTEPVRGWSDPGLELWFKQQYGPVDSAVDVKKKEKAKLHTIIGVVVGSTVAAAIFFVGVWYYRRRRDNKKWEEAVNVRPFSDYAGGRIEAGIAPGTQVPSASPAIGGGGFGGTGKKRYSLVSPPNSPPLGHQKERPISEMPGDFVTPTSPDPNSSAWSDTGIPLNKNLSTTTTHSTAAPRYSAVPSDTDLLTIPTSTPQASTTTSFVAELDGSSASPSASTSNPHQSYNSALISPATPSFNHNLSAPGTTSPYLVSAETSPYLGPQESHDSVQPLAGSFSGSTGMGTGAFSRQLELDEQAAVSQSLLGEGERAENEPRQWRGR